MRWISIIFFLCVILGAESCANEAGVSQRGRAAWGAGMTATWPAAWEQREAAAYRTLGNVTGRCRRSETPTRRRKGRIRIKEGEEDVRRRMSDSRDEGSRNYRELLDHEEGRETGWNVWSVWGGNGRVLGKVGNGISDQGNGPRVENGDLGRDTMRQRSIDDGRTKQDGEDRWRGGAERDDRRDDCAGDDVEILGPCDEKSFGWGEHAGGRTYYTAGGARGNKTSDGEEHLPRPRCTGHLPHIACNIVCTIGPLAFLCAERETRWEANTGRGKTKRVGAARRIGGRRYSPSRRSPRIAGRCLLIRTYRMPGAERKEEQEEVLREAPVDIAEGCPARSEGPQEVATRVAAERCADEDIAFKSTGDITLLDLRGGGGPPGAGVWNWLTSESEHGGDAADMHADCEEDSDNGEDPPPLDSDEESDAAEPEELQEELEGGEQEAGEETARHQADEEQSQEPRGTPMGPIITGRRGETQVMICPRCNCDVPTRALASHSCGEVSAAAADADDSGNMAATRGGQVRRLISLWEALQNGGPADGVGTLGAQGGGELPGARHEDAQQGWDASLTEWPANLWPCEGQRLPNLIELANYAYWRETGGAYTEWEQSEGGQAPPGDQEHHAGGGGIRWREDACQECLLPFPTAGTEWRICACSSLYCAGCARGPCSSCGAAYVWREEGEQGLGERTTGSQEAESEDCGRAADSQHGPTSMGARTWTPSELHKRRCIERDKAIAERRKARMQGRTERKEQRRQGKRPWRERRRQACASFMTVNATCAESLKKELTHGQDLARSDYIMCQELGLRGEKKAIAETWAATNGWDVTIDEAYIKQSRCEGGRGGPKQGKDGDPPDHPTTRGDRRETHLGSRLPRLRDHGRLVVWGDRLQCEAPNRRVATHG